MRRKIGVMYWTDASRRQGRGTGGQAWQAPGFLARRAAILRKSVGFNEMPRRGVGITRFPTWAAVLNYRGSARGLRFTVSFRIGAVFHGGRKTADFLGDRFSVRVVFGSGTTTLKCGRRPAGIHRNRSAAQEFFHR